MFIVLNILTTVPPNPIFCIYSTSCKENWIFWILFRVVDKQIIFESKIDFLIFFQADGSGQQVNAPNTESSA